MGNITDTEEVNPMKAPEIKRYMNWLGRIEYRNINCSFTYDAVSYEAIDRIFRLLHRLEPDPENTSWELWLRAERGAIEDFGSFEELLEDGQVENFEEFETWWHSEFPEEAAWFHFAAGEDQEIGYRAIFLGHRHVLEVDGRRERSFPNDISKFTAWLEEAVRNAVQMVETGSYQELVERELPIWHRTGTILRRDLWRVFPQWKAEFFQDFAQQEMKEFLAYVEDTTDRFAAQAKSPLIRQIHRKVTEVKQNPKMEVEYMTLMQRDRENIELGREEGAKMALDIIRLHMDGKTDQEIAAILSLRTDYVRQFLVDYENSQG